MVVVAPATRNCHNVTFLLGPRPPPIDVCLDWPELVPVPSGGEIYGDWDYISEGLDATLFPPKSLQSVLVCLPRCRKALTGAVCHIAFHQLSLVADFIYLQDPSPAAFRQVSMAITRQARLNSIRCREEREYRHLPDARLDWDELPASTCRVRTCERFGKPFSSVGSLRVHLRRSAFHKVPYVVTCWSLPPEDRLKMVDRLHFIMSSFPVLYKGLEGVLARCRPCPPLQPPLRLLPRPWPQLPPRPQSQLSPRPPAPDPSGSSPTYRASRTIRPHSPPRGPSIGSHCPLLGLSPVPRRPPLLLPPDRSRTTMTRLTRSSFPHLLFRCPPTGPHVCPPPHHTSGIPGILRLALVTVQRPSLVATCRPAPIVPRRPAWLTTRGDPRLHCYGSTMELG